MLLPNGTPLSHALVYESVLPQVIFQIYSTRSVFRSLLRIALGRRNEGHLIYCCTVLAFSLNSAPEDDLRVCIVARILQVAHLALSQTQSNIVLDCLWGPTRVSHGQEDRLSKKKPSASHGGSFERPRRLDDGLKYINNTLNLVRSRWYVISKGRTSLYCRFFFLHA